MAQVQSRIVHTFPQESGILPLDAIRYGAQGNRSLFMAVQQGLFEQDETAWNFDEGGQWRGPVPCRTVCSNLRALDATEERVGADVVQRLASGSAVVAAWGVLEKNSVTGGHWAWRLTSLANGAEVASGQSPTPGAAVAAAGTVPDGSYLLTALLEGASQEFRLPPGYTRNPIYSYGSAESDYWDYTRNVGKLPPPGHPFYDLRAALLLDNKQSDTGEDADYIIGPGLVGGEWSGRLIILGDGPLTVGANVLPPCGPSLYKAPSRYARVPVAFDVMARTGNKLAILADGALYMAGQRMTPTGLVMGLWRTTNGVVWQLLGTNLNPTNGLCECALANHGPTDILQLADGTIKVLTKCSKHVYRPQAALVENRLPGDPEQTDGHPGGQSLRLWQGREYHTTENFGETAFAAPDGTILPQFYDVLIIQYGTGITKGQGTVFHGACDMASYMGKLWGIMQDKPFGADDATQYITWYDGARWSFETTLQYPAKAFHWQRLSGFESAEDYTLVVWGKRAESEERLMGVANGREFNYGTFPYAIRRATASDAADTNPPTKRRVLLCPARQTDKEYIYPDWHIVETTGKGNTAIVSCDSSECPEFCTTVESLLAQGISLADLPTYLVLTDAGWRGQNTLPGLGISFLRLQIDLQAGTVCYVWDYLPCEIPYNPDEGGYCTTIEKLEQCDRVDIKETPILKVATDFVAQYNEVGHLKDNTGHLTEWKNTVKGGGSLLPTLGLAPPLIMPNIKNGLPAPAFDYNRATLQGPNLTVGTVAIVAMYRPEVSGANVFDTYNGLMTGTGSDENNIYWIGSQKTNRWYGNTQLNRRLNGAPEQDMANPGEWSVYSGTDATPNARTVQFSADRIYGRQWVGYIAEIIIWDRVLTPEELEGVDAYLKEKWITPRSLGMPPYLILDPATGCWLPADEPPTDGTPYLILTPGDGGELCYLPGPGVTIPGNPIRGGGIIIGGPDKPWCPYGPPPCDCEAFVIDVLTGEVRRAHLNPDGSIDHYCDDLPVPPAGSEVAVLTLLVTPGEEKYAIQAMDSGRGRVLEDFCRYYKAIRVRVDGLDLPPNDRTTFDMFLPYSVWAALPTPARKSIEVWFEYPGGTSLEDVVPSFFVRN